MKNLTLILAILFINLSIFAQDGFRINKTEYFTVGMFVDPVASLKEKGLDFGFEIEYVGTIYARLGLENFSALEGGYFAGNGAIGINFTSGYFEKFRYYVGVTGGRVLRNGVGNVIGGFEAGMDFKLSDSWAVGGRISYINRQDMLAMNWEPIWRENGYLRIVYYWNWRG